LAREAILSGEWELGTAYETGQGACDAQDPIDSGGQSVFRPGPPAKVFRPGRGDGVRRDQKPAGMVFKAGRGSFERGSMMCREKQQKQPARFRPWWGFDIGQACHAPKAVAAARHHLRPAEGAWGTIGGPGGRRAGRAGSTGGERVAGMGGTGRISRSS